MKAPHVLLCGPFNSKQEKVQVSPGVGIPSSPSEQLIVPLPGASSVGHVVTKKVQIINKVSILAVQ